MDSDITQVFVGFSVVQVNAIVRNVRRLINSRACTLKGFFYQ